MADQEILKQISYRKGYILTIPDSARKDPQRYEVMVIRYETKNNQLLLRSDVGAPFLSRGMKVLVEAWGRDALYRLMGTIDSATPNQHEQYVIALDIEEVSPVQRRSSRRYQTRYPTTFMPARKQSVQVAWDPTHYEQGHATNIGLGGMQLETDINLPRHCIINCNVSVPGGTLHAEGRIVSKRGDPLGSFVYGVEFLRYDNLTSQRLNSLVLRIERATQQRPRSIIRQRKPAQRVVRREQRRRTRRGRWSR